MTTSRTIGEAYRAFEAAFHRGDADAISRMYTEDAELLIPEAPIFRGREAIRGVGLTSCAQVAILFAWRLWNRRMVEIGLTR
jgi:ketosteroid isomerase-like protein